MTAGAAILPAAGAVPDSHRMPPAPVAPGVNPDRDIEQFILAEYAEMTENGTHGHDNRGQGHGEGAAGR